MEGPLGKLQWEHRPEVSVGLRRRPRSSSSSAGTTTSGQARALHGLTRALIANMVVGVTKGYEKSWRSSGVGYLAAVQKGHAATARRLRQRSASADSRRA